MVNLILLAVQGAGKGTVAETLQSKYNYVHISTGDILRARAAMGDEVGLNIKTLIDQGELVPDDTMLEIIESRITQDDCVKGYILDGFPRTLEQAKRYDELLAKLNKDIGIVVNMTIPVEALIARIKSRRICINCRRIFNTSFHGMLPAVEGKCDDCGSDLVFREDDSNDEAIMRRVETYHKNAEAIIDFYNKKGNLYTVDVITSKNATIEIEQLINE